MLTRRGFIGFLAAPAIVRASSLMPIAVSRTRYVVSTLEEFDPAVLKALIARGATFGQALGIAGNIAFERSGVRLTVAG